jgi:Ser/Thr protein kinase RdoA (MazF antagonist)
MEVLERALLEHPTHRLASKVRPLADAVLEAWAKGAGDLNEPTQFAHGDLKISNLRFRATGEGLCLLDLDTMGQLPLSVELGDAWRSWCNTATEDAPQARFDLSLFHASARGYLSERPLPAWQLELLPLGVQRICLELAARFLADALNESYFGWDPNKAATRGAHNLIRGAGQLSLAQSVQEQLPKMAVALRS